MKGLIFNLLNTMAQKSGCADEAWDLVMEFVASETEHDSPSDTCTSCFDGDPSTLPFEAPAEAMIACLAGEHAGIGESLSEFPELSLASELEERVGDSLPPLWEPEPAIAGARPGCSEGFSHDLLSLLEQLLAEALSGSSGEDDDAEEQVPAALASGRRSNS